jgi:dipeptidyl aminopeptidase/acylaminoacyl peptidase
MAEEASIWVGRDEHNGVLSEPRSDVEPPPHWRLEAIVRTPRPRSLTVSADRRQVVYIEDAETSDVWLLDLEDPRPRRLTTGRAPAPYWDDIEPRLSPNGQTVAYGDEGHVWIAPTAGGPPRRLVEGGSPVWVGNARLVVTVERDRATRLAVIHTADPWPQRLASRHFDLVEHGDEGQAAVSPDATEVAYAFTPRADLNRSEIRVASLKSGEVRALTGTPRMHDREPNWSPDGQQLLYASERSGFYELHLVAANGSGERQLTNARADHSETDWHPDGKRVLAVRGRRNRFDVVSVDADDGSAELVEEGGTWSSPHWAGAGGIVAAYEDHATPPELRLSTHAHLHTPAPMAIRSAPHAKAADVLYRSFDGLEIPAFLMRPANASAAAPVPAVVYPHGGPTSFYGDEWDGFAQFFVDKGYAWLAINFRGSTGYGRDFERANHGVWGVEDTRDCLAAADYLRTLDWVDGERLGIFGASYGSYMALLSVTDDPDQRYRCAVAKYGDCDMVSSWAQGDREGVQDLERMMGPPAAARAEYRAGSAFPRLANVEVPVLVAHGERDKRVHPKQSELLTGELRRLGKTFEYVTYPTEAHGLLRAGPALHFYQRLERFLDWYLM